MLKVLEAASLFLDLEKVPSYGLKQANTIYTVALYMILARCFSSVILLTKA